MKKKFIFLAASAAIALSATAAGIASAAKQSNPIFEANIETLSNGETSAGPLCMQVKDRLCVYPDMFEYEGVWDN